MPISILKMGGPIQTARIDVPLLKWSGFNVIFRRIEVLGQNPQCPTQGFRMGIVGYGNGDEVHRQSDGGTGAVPPPSYPLTCFSSLA